MKTSTRINLFRKKYLTGTATDRFFQWTETALKCALLLILPIPFTLLAVSVWYLGFFKQGIHFNEHLEGIASAAWIPTFGILYGLLAAIVLSTVWNEYKSMRVAIKRYDVDTFVDLRDEEMSPLVHTMMFVLSGSVLAAFMGFKYPDALSGVLMVGSTSYLFSLIYYVVIEIDDPCTGIWFIKNIHKEWLEIDVKKWHRSRWDKARGEQKY